MKQCVIQLYDVNMLLCCVCQQMETALMKAGEDILDNNDYEKK